MRRKSNNVTTADVKFPRSPLRGAAILAASALALAGCGTAESLDTGPAAGAGGGVGDGGTIVVGSQDYYSNEIIAEIYSQALESEGFDVSRDYRIGQREVYVADIESGAISVFPEYTGPMLDYWKSDYTARTAEEIHAELMEVAPDNLEVLDMAEATDQDSYVVTREFAEANDVWSLVDLADYSGTLVVGGNSELEERPHGPEGLRDVYGVDVTFTPIEDSGGPLTIKALTDGDIHIANVYSASPAIETNDLVVLEDPEGLCVAANVVPIVSGNLSIKAARILDEVSAKLDQEDLVAMNARSVDEQENSATIAEDWISENF